MTTLENLITKYFHDVTKEYFCELLVDVLLLKMALKILMSVFPFWDNIITPLYFIVSKKSTSLRFDFQSLNILTFCSLLDFFCLSKRYLLG